MTSGQLAFALGALAGIAAVLLELRFNASAPILVAFCVGALAIVVAVGRRVEAQAQSR